MAYSCIPSIQSSFALNTSIVNHHKLESFSLTFKPLPPRVLRSKNVNGKIRRSLKANARTPKDERAGIWSIRDDLSIPSSPYVPVYAEYFDEDEGVDPTEMFPTMISQLFQYRIIRCGGAVDDDMANMIVTQLLYLDAVDPTKDIVMYVNSPGGSVTAGMAIFDTMKHIRPDVSTVCVGLAASMGAFLLSAGTKGKRFSLPNSRIMIHQPIGDIDGDIKGLEVQLNEILHHKANLGGYLAYLTGQKLQRIDDDTQCDFFMSAKEAIDYGLIDGVITNPLNANLPLAAAIANQTS